MNKALTYINSGSSELICIIQIFSREINEKALTAHFKYFTDIIWIRRIPGKPNQKSITINSIQFGLSRPINFNSTIQ